MNKMNKVKWLRLMGFAALLAVFLPYAASAGVTEEWAASYDSGSKDMAYAVAAAPSGGAVTTGYSGGGFATIKYDSQGNELWARTYSGGPGGTGALDLALDSSGSVYVTGTVGGSMVTIKYDPYGEELWVARYPCGAGTCAYAIAPDSSGGAYVTGSSRGVITTIKYDTYGNQSWLKRQGAGVGRDVAVDSLGNVFVTGSVRSGPGYDYITIKYTSFGSVGWIKRYNGGSNDVAIALAVDPSGSVFVTGKSRAAIGTSGYDLLTIKYGSGGNVYWVKRYDGGVSDRPNALALDPSGGVYVMGNIHNSAGTIKYDTYGNEEWVRTYDGGSGEEAGALGVDGEGRAYVTVESNSGGGSDFATIKYDTDGTELWVKFYDGGGADRPSSIALDGSGGVFVAGYSTGGLYSGGSAYTTVKYSQSPLVCTPGDLVAVVGEMLGDGRITNYGVANSLVKKLTNAEAKLVKNPGAAANILEAAINSVEAQSGKHITTGAAYELVGFLDDVLACSL